MLAKQEYVNIYSGMQAQQLAHRLDQDLPLQLVTSIQVFSWVVSPELWEDVACEQP